MKKKDCFSEGLRGRFEWYIEHGLHHRADRTVKAVQEMCVDLDYCAGSKGGNLIYLIQEMYPFIAEQMRNRKHSGYSDRVKRALKSFHGYIQSGQHLIDADTIKTLKWIAEEIGYKIPCPTICKWVHKFYPQLKPLFKKSRKGYLLDKQQLEAA